MVLTEELIIAAKISMAICILQLELSNTCFHAYYYVHAVMFFLWQEYPRYVNCNAFWKKWCSKCVNNFLRETLVWIYYVYEANSSLSRQIFYKICKVSLTIIHDNCLYSLVKLTLFTFYVGSRNNSVVNESLRGSNYV